jgi:hypothetical protein
MAGRHYIRESGLKAAVLANDTPGTELRVRLDAEQIRAEAPLSEVEDVVLARQADGDSPARPKIERERILIPPTRKEVARLDFRRHRDDPLAGRRHSEAIPEVEIVPTEGKDDASGDLEVLFQPL